MSVTAVLMIVCGLPLLTNSLEVTCPAVCSCDKSRTDCSNLKEIPNRLPYTKALYISNSHSLREIRSYAFTDESYNCLETLEITSAGLHNIQDFAFSGSHHLKEIKFTDTGGPASLNQNSLQGLEELESFEASGIVGLQTIGFRAFYAMTHLKILKLQENGIESIHPYALEGVNGLENFDVSYNPALKSIPQMLLSHIGTLETININDCSLTTLYKDYFLESYMTNALKDFQATGNNWDCDANMCPMTQWLRHNYNFDYVSHLGYCVTPINLYGVTLMTLGESDTCDSKYEDYDDYMYVAMAVFIGSIFVTCARWLCKRGWRQCCYCNNDDGNYLHDGDNNEGIDNNFDIASHDRAALRSPDPPSYETVVNSSASLKTYAYPPPYDDDDDVAPPDYEV